ncbi:MAG: hypothetical protein CMC35_01750 [Flavobacteriaceae bacterium]|nr:hypothetical protein [Flavobacteriaceae bacterium]|tara:strand:- start:19638 stop:20657 length:1020 start_codon:yes stop_codon:yes gene_type:complete
MKIFFLILTTALNTFGLLAQNILTVDNTPGSSAQFDDLQTAISSAQNGDIIYVHASNTNYGDILIDKNISLIGFSHSNPEKNSVIDEIDLTDNASNTRISGFRITNDFYLNNDISLVSNLVLENNLFENPVSFGGTALTDGLLIRGNVFLSGLGNTTTVFSQYSNAIITNNIFDGTLHVLFNNSIDVKNNIFLGSASINNLDPSSGNINAQDCIFYADRATTVNYNSTGVFFEHCLSYNITGNVLPLNGNNNINDTDPLFFSATNENFDSLDDDYRLQNGSPGIGTGISGGDLGIFDSSGFLFNNFGITQGIPSIKILSITSQIAPEENLEVIIESNTN